MNYAELMCNDRINEEVTKVNVSHIGVEATLAYCFATGILPYLQQKTCVKDLKISESNPILVQEVSLCGYREDYIILYPLNMGGRKINEASFPPIFRQPSPS